MKVGIVGIGLIGGSFAKAYKKEGHTVYAFDTDSTMLNFAQLSGVVDGVLNNKTLPLCDIIIIAVLPKHAIDYLKNNAQFISKDAIVIDCCGTKKDVCDACFEIAEQNGITFVGGHPMAGKHQSGFKNSCDDLFVGAPMVLVPKVHDDPVLLARAENLLSPVGFGGFSITTAETHDRIIAFTSQMPHIISNAFIKSPTAPEHKGFSAGSYKDLTRVSWLDAKLWSELCMNNSENILNELNGFINELCKYKEAIENNDTASLETLLKEGKDRKHQIDG